MMLMFCRVMTAQVDYIITLYEDNYMMQEKEILCKRVASPSPAISHLGMHANICVTCWFTTPTHDDIPQIE